ncbi:MAG: leucine-rich repeat domain-containing protein [Firmicutes bacterium]|nr:leucine-rich repeat domain-containing protein [Bacillota bacterium]
MQRLIQEIKELASIGASFKQKLKRETSEARRTMENQATRPAEHSGEYLLTEDSKAEKRQNSYALRAVLLVSAAAVIVLCAIFIPMAAINFSLQDNGLTWGLARRAAGDEPVYCAYKSDKSEYGVGDDIILTFYFGSGSDFSPGEGSYTMLLYFSGVPKSEPASAAYRLAEPDAPTLVFADAANTADTVGVARRATRGLHTVQPLPLSGSITQALPLSKPASSPYGRADCIVVKEIPDFFAAQSLLRENAATDSFNYIFPFLEKLTVPQELLTGKSGTVAVYAELFKVARDGSLLSDEAVGGAGAQINYRIAGSRIKLSSGGKADVPSAVKEHVHDYGPWTVTTPPSCTEGGEETRACKNFDPSHTETRSSPALGHDEGAWVTGPPPDCTHGFGAVLVCGRCGEHLDYSDIPALGHDWEWVVTTAPTETADGLETLTCGRCGETDGTRIAYALGTAGLVFLPIEDGVAFSVKAASASLGGAVVIPAYHERLPVTSIANQAFTSCAGITSVSIPDGITEIGEWAFADCTALTAVTLPDGLIKIGARAFLNCGVQTLAVPHKVTSIGEYAFYLSGLRSVTIPINVLSIGNAAFTGNITVYAEAPAQPEGWNPGWKGGSLGAVYFGVSISDITFFGGAQYRVLDGDAVLVRYIGDAAEFTVPSSVTINEVSRKVALIGERAFAFGDIAKITIPGNDTAVGNYAFYRCYSLTDAVIGNGVTHIGVSAFADCTGLKNLSFSENRRITAIGDSAFFGCEALLSLDIPVGVTEIGELAFYRCKKLSRLDIPNGVEQIGKSAFDICEGLIRVTIPATLTVIPDSAFYGCDRLEEVIFAPGSMLTGIGNAAFCYSNLTHFAMPKSITDIGGGAFSDSPNLKTITLPAGLSTLGGGMWSASPITVYAEAETQPTGWAVNLLSRPVLWGCTLADDGNLAYVESWAKTGADSLSNPGAYGGINAPYRAGHAFGGWATSSELAALGEAAYTAAELGTAYGGIPIGTRLYAIWTPAG